jgi:oxalate---CoA ligase
MNGKRAAAVSTIPEVLRRAEQTRPAIRGRNGVNISYAELCTRTDAFAEQLTSAGATRTTRIAVVLQNGQRAALAFLGTVSAAICSPLNPNYTESEFAFALQDLPASLVIVDGTVPAAAAAAGALGIPLVTLREDGTLGRMPRTPCRSPRPDDVALVLHTSGTTGRPKRVPLTHANLTASGRNVASSLCLAPDDRCLNVMPLFHIHGLVGAVLASLCAGSSVECEPGFEPFSFFPRLAETKATWYTAVPTIHHAILTRSDRNAAARDSRLRFTRSSSSAMPPSLMANIEGLFGVPLIEAYGMTEASHQIASNPLPPGERRPGSVGVPRGVEVEIVGTDGRRLPPLQAGEMVIRGSSVTAGYEAAGADTATLPGGWLRTGDQGYFDRDGYVFLTGRIKELINRGGEKVAPREVEDVLLAHPSVSQAVAFALPHASLGEEVAAAVVVSPTARTSVAELRAFAASRLASFKVPRKLVLIDAIPLGPTGKPLRVGMAERLGLV